MLIGSVQHSLDTKGRYIVPSKFRKDLGDYFVVTEGINGCLFVFSMTQWEQVAARLAEMPAEDDDTLLFKREFFSSAYDLEVDKQFRIVIPPLLRERAGLTKEIVSVGMTTRLEIWDKEKWEAYGDPNVREVSQQKKRSLLAGVVL